MKRVDIGSSIGLDRLATWNEIMRAVTVSPDGVLALGSACSHSLVMDSDFSGSACNFPEDDMWFAIAREMPDSKSN